MSNSEIKSRFYILHVEVSHGKIKFLKSNRKYLSRTGADRYDIHIHLERPPLVRDLMEEVEKKARVTLMNQQLIFRGKDTIRERIRIRFFLPSRSTFTSNTE
jgi:hypothetical protein